MNILEIKKLCKKYGEKTAVSDINLSIEKGDIFGLLGPNGAGKSTTISMISGVLKPTSGSISIKGIDINKDKKNSIKYLGVVPQDIALYPTLSAEENLYFWGKMHDVRGDKLKNRVKEVLRIVNLEDKKKERIENYSGGMKRRINIAAALIHEPEILIMDEPTVGIDPQSRNHILETVKELNKEGLTIIYTSHYMEEVEFLCKNVAIVDQGKILAIDEKEELKRKFSDSDKLIIKVSKINPEILKVLESLEFVIKANLTNNIEIFVDNASERMVDVIGAIVKKDMKILQVKIEEPNLESVFLSLTGKGLRD